MEKRGKVEKKQNRVRIRKSYSKEKFLFELNKEDWNFQNNNMNNNVDKAEETLENNIAKLSNNLRRALSKVAPIKIINVRREEEPWKQGDDTEKLMNDVKSKWNNMKKIQKMHN